MGLFNKDKNEQKQQTCPICGKKLNLNRVKIAKDNAFICSECYNKAGGVYKVNPNTSTLAEIKALIK